MKWFYVIAAVGVVALAAAPFWLLEPEDAERFEGKTVAYGIYGSKVNSLDPATAGDTTSASIQGAVYRGLYTYHYLLRPLEVIPDLAAAMPEVSHDKLTYTIRLRDDVRYAPNPCFGAGSDGAPLTRRVRAEDFVLAFKRIADFHVSTKLSWAFVGDKIVGLKDYRGRTKSYHKGDFSRYDLPLEGVEAPDEETLRIHLIEPFPQLIYVLAMQSYAPIPREVVDYWLAAPPRAERSPEIRDIRAMPATGAYVITERVRAHKIVMERNPEFHGTYPEIPDDETLTPAQRDSVREDVAAGLYEPAGRPVPFCDARHMVFVQESNPAWMMFRKKLTDTSGIPRDVFDLVIGPDRELDETWRRQGARLVKTTDPSVFWYAFNMDDPVVGASRSLRQAMCLSYDVEEHVEVLFNGRGKPATNTLPSSFPGHAAAGPSPYARFDLEAAREKIEQAKEELAAAGVIEPGEEIPPITLDMAGQDEIYRRMGEVAQRQFRRIGVELKIEMNDWPTLQEKVHNKVTQMYTMGWHADYPDPENFLQLYYTPNIERGTNNTNYSNGEFDRLFARTAAMMPSPERTALYVRMVRILNEDCPVLLLTEPEYYILVYDWVLPYKPHPIGYGYRKYIRIDPDLRREMGGR